MKVFSFFSLFMISILFHELGHYYAGKIFKVRALRFTIGVGPSLFETYSSGTEFSIRLFPLMGLVEHDERDINGLSLLKNIIILLAGVFNNLILGMFSLLVLCKFKFMLMLNIMFTDMIPSILSAFSNLKSLIGEDGTISHAYSAIPVSNFQQVWILFAIVNMGLVFGNLIPIPALDGGQIILFTLQRLLEKFGLSREAFNKIVNPIIWLSFVLLLSFPIINEILATKNPKLYAIYAVIGILIWALFRVFIKTEVYRKNFK